MRIIINWINCKLHFKESLSQEDYLWILSAMIFCQNMLEINLINVTNIQWKVAGNQITQTGLKVVFYIHKYVYIVRSPPNVIIFQLRLNNLDLFFLYMPTITSIVFCVFPGNLTHLNGTLPMTDGYFCALLRSYRTRFSPALSYVVRERLYSYQ